MVQHREIKQRFTQNDAFNSLRLFSHHFCWIQREMVQNKRKKQKNENYKCLIDVYDFFR